MLAIEVVVDGERRQLAGIDDWDLLHLNLRVHRAQPDGEGERRLLCVGALPRQAEEGVLEHARWEELELGPGAEVTLRLREVEQADPPRKRYRSDATVQENPYTDAEWEAMQRADYERLKAKFERPGGSPDAGR